MLDEIDKLGRDFRAIGECAAGDLDPSRIIRSADNYLDQPFDLARCCLSARPPAGHDSGPLLDRMEIIELTGYTEEEKVNIAVKYLIPHRSKRTALRTSRSSSRWRAYIDCAALHAGGWRSQAGAADRHRMP